jgi:hypothetical protein
MFVDLSSEIILATIAGKKTVDRDQRCANSGVRSWKPEVEAAYGNRNRRYRASGGSQDL